MTTLERIREGDCSVKKRRTGLECRGATRSILIQGEGLLEVLQEQRSEFWWLDHGHPAGPAEKPMDDLIETIDGEAEGDAAILVAFDGLGGVPGGLRDQFGRILGNSDLDRVRLGSAIDPPGVAEVGLEIEVVGDHRGGVEGSQRLESSQPVGLRLV